MKYARKTAPDSTGAVWFTHQAVLLQRGKRLRSVSAPSLEIFEKQTEEYKTQVLGDKKVFAMELSSDASWYKYVTDKNGVINLTEFSVTGNEHDLYKHFGFTVQEEEKNVDTPWKTPMSYIL